jgi:acetyl-CoA carboxylase biotin carboxyl carrier protein
MTRNFEIDGDAIRQLANILVETDLSEIEYEDNGKRVRVARTVAAAAMVMPAPALAPSTPSPTPETPTKTDAASHPGAVKSPLVGTVYVASEPGVPPFVSVGDSVSVGQTLLIIEAMKVMNPIKATRAGQVKQIFVTDSQPVEFGEPLLIIE